MTDEAYRQRVNSYLALLGRHQGILLWLCLRYARFRKYLALDYMQDVNERIWRTFDELRADASAGEERSWVAFQAHSVLSNHLRRRRPPLVPLDALGDLADDSLQRQEEVELIDELLSHLPDDDRQLLLDYSYGIPTEKMASDRGIRPEALRQRLTAARRRFRAVYDKLYNTKE